MDEDGLTWRHRTRCGSEDPSTQARNFTELKPDDFRIATFFDTENKGNAIGPRQIPINAQRFAGIAYKVAFTK